MESRKINILLVEDDEVDIMNIRRAFKKGNIGNSLFIARNGLEAISILQGNENEGVAVPSSRLLILLDLNMPKMGGIEFLQLLRSDLKLKSIPVVVLTTSDEEMDRMQAYNLNVAGYLLKPIMFNPFVEMMEVLISYCSHCEMP